MRALVVEHGVIRREDLDDEFLLDSLQAAVGGYIELAARIPVGPDRTLDVYCNEEGLLQDLEPTCWLQGQRLVGPLVIVAGNPRTGGTQGLHEAECRDVRLLRPDGGQLPTLDIRSGHFPELVA